MTGLRMTGEPWFWRSDTLAARAISAALTPAALIYQAGHRLRWRLARPARAALPVICIGNATLGGTGKTPFAILAATLLAGAGVKCCFLTRGYGGAQAGPLLVDPDRHGAEDVGDEALLLARHGPVIVARNRPAGAARAAETGAQAIIMDDGFQNPALHKDLSILLVAGDQSGGAQRLFPAGPYREPLAAARARAGLVISVGATQNSADFHAALEPAGGPAPARVFAFAGIARPARFFDALRQAGFETVQEVAFPDHHPFTDQELAFLQREAARLNARLICTEKDHVRLPAALRADVLTLPVAMTVNDPARLKSALLRAVNPHTAESRGP